MASDLPARFDRIDQRFDAIEHRIDEGDAETRRRIDESAAETRRHFDVVAESMLSKIQIVAEGVIAVDRKVDRLADEIRGELTRVNRRMLARSARVPPKRRR